MARRPSHKYLTHKQWARKLRMLRESRELRQEDVANSIHISRPHYCALENAQAMINYDLLVALAKSFKMSMGEFMQMDGVGESS